MRDYGKIQTAFWTSDDIRGLSDHGRLLALYLLSGPHTNQIGCFRLPDGYACEDLGWDSETVSKGFHELSENGFATRDETNKWVIVHRFLKWNEIENPNQGKSAARLFDQVPEKSSVKPLLARALRDFAPRFPVDVLDKFETVSKPLGKPFRNQEQEQEQEQELTKANALVVESAASDLLADGVGSPVSRPPCCPHRQILDLYHKRLPANPHIRDWTAARQEVLRARWNESPERQTLDWWDRFFAYIAESRFLTGRSSTPGRKPFVPGLEWICKAENFAKIREGRYEDQECVA